MHRSHPFYAVAILLISCAALARAAEKPNIIFILSDDQGSYDVGWRGSEIKTPHLDALAAQGTRLEEFYVQPVCSPTRAALMTGRYPMRYGLQAGVIRPDAEYGLPLEERMLPQALRDVGYTTAMCGKWHLGEFEKAYWPNQRGFDHFYGHLLGALDYFTHYRQQTLDWWRNGEPNKDEGYTTHLLADEAARLIREQPKDKPLFLYVPFNAVHGPLQVPEEYKKPYAHLPEPRRTYAGMLAAMDEGVGKIVAAVDETGGRDNTLFIFHSDNGGPAPGEVTDNGPLRSGKGSLYEGGVRTCAFATWPGHIPVGEVDALAHVTDWYPTLLALTGASLEQKLPIDGKNLWPSLTKGAPSERTEVLLNAQASRGALRIGDWKLVLHVSDQDASMINAELFNLAKDPGEQNNLAEKNPEKLAELRTRYDTLAAQAVPSKKEEPKGDDE